MKYDKIKTVLKYSEKSDRIQAILRKVSHGLINFYYFKWLYYSYLKVFILWD